MGDGWIILISPWLGEGGRGVGCRSWELEMGKGLSYFARIFVFIGGYLGLGLKIGIRKCTPNCYHADNVSVNCY